MSLYGLFNAFWLYADIPLCYRCGAVLREPLDKGNVKAVVAVNLGGVPFPKAVGADSLIAQILANNRKLLLNHARGDGKHLFCRTDPIPQTIVFDVLLDHQRNGEDALFPRPLFVDASSKLSHCAAGICGFVLRFKANGRTFS